LEYNSPKPEVRVHQTVGHIREKNMLKFGRWILGLSILFSQIVICSSSFAQERKPIIFAGDRDYPPVEYLRDGKPTGMFHDLLQELSKVLRREIDHQLNNWKESQKKVLNGEADALTVFGATEERRKLYDFTEPIFPMEFAFFVQRDNVLIHSIDDLNGKRVGITQGGLPKQFLATKKQIRIVFIKNYLEGFRLLLSGDVDAVAANKWVGAYTIQQEGIQGIKLIQKPFVISYAPMAVKKGNYKLLNELNEGIRELKKARTIDVITKRWSSQEIVYLTKEKIRAGFIIAGTATLIIAIFVTILWAITLRKQNNKLRREIVERQAAEEKLRKYQENLEDMVTARTTELSAEKFRSVFEDSGIGMVLVDRNGRYCQVNKAMSQIFGYTQQELLSKSVSETSLSGESDQDSDMVRQLWAGEIKDLRVEKRYLHKDGHVVWGDITLSSLRDAEGKTLYIVGQIQDISDKKLAGEHLKASLKEKEILLSEIHHRVKNNMQVISSLLKIQSDKIQDKAYADMFKESNDRIRSMSLVHEKLYQSKDFANVDFNGYVKGLVNSLFRSYGIDTNKIKAKIEVEGISLGVDTAVPCGLLINELVSNSLKHAFPEKRNGEIRIALRSINEDEFELKVSDDGIGIPQDLDIKNTESFGMELISILVDQLDGQIDLDRTAGTRYQIKLKRQKYRPRI
jgi:PAS domain S-box-containing protein